MVQIERKSFRTEIKAVDEPQGIIEAIVSVFNNVDEGGDRVMPGCFKASIAKKLPKGVWMHDWEQPVAKTLQAKELLPGDKMLPPSLAQLGGLYIKAQFNLATQRGKEAFSDIMFGIVDEFSIGYWPTKTMYLDDDPDHAWRELVECDLLEWSPVLVGMNRETVLISAKSGEGDILIDGKPFAQDLQTVIAAAKRIAERAKAKQGLLTKQGRMLSQANCDMLKELSGTLQDAHVSIASVFQAIDDLVDSALGEPEDEEPAAGDAGKSLLDMLALQQKQAEVELALALVMAA